MSLERTGEEARHFNKNSESMQLLNRVVKYMPEGYLAQMQDCEMSRSVHLPESPERRDNEGGDKPRNDVPLGSPEYYYFPPELISGEKGYSRLCIDEINKYGNIGKGLSNPGWNTCYFNSILQALTYAPYLLSDCLRRNHQYLQT